MQRERAGVMVIFIFVPSAKVTSIEVFAFPTIAALTNAISYALHQYVVNSGHHTIKRLLCSSNACGVVDVVTWARYVPSSV